MLKLFRYLKLKDWLLILLCVALIVAQVWLDLKLPDYMQEITILIETEGSTMADILSAGGKMLLCALGSLISAVIVGFFAAKIAAGFSMELRGRVYHKVSAFSMKEINQFSTASLINRTTNDITQIQMLVTMGLQVVIKAPVMAVIAIGKISSKSWQWSALTGGVVVFLIAIILILMAYTLPKFKKIQGLIDDLNRVTRENLTGLQVVRAYNAENYQEKKFDDANNALMQNNLKANTAMSVLNPTINIAMNALTVGIYWIGAFLIYNVALTGPESVFTRLTLFSDMVVFSSYAMQVVMAFMMLVMICIMLPRASVSAKRILEVLNTKATIKDGARVNGENGLSGEVEFRDVSFRYADSGENAIEHISFTAHGGETVALIGATGCGKSTIINLIPRLYDVTAGEVLVDGVNVKEYTLDALNAKIGFVPQKAFLFSGTVESNIGYGEEALSEEELQKAAAIAQAKDFIESGVGYDGAVAQGGSNFSGGQKQRLSIARAVAKAPEIFVFDDSFSALDYKTDRILRSALKKETKGATNIIVAQRIGTIMDADKILVIADGKIVGSGKHEELLKTCELYREIAHSQLSKEELGA